MAAPTTEIADELKTYLTADCENVGDALVWWAGKKKTYPQLSRMALDYLCIPGKYGMALSCVRC
jgi:hAT family C-terminal dimerisation region